METINNVLDRTVDLHPDLVNEQFESTLNGLHRLLDELARPENRELMRFAVAWRRLEDELAKLQRKIEERAGEKPINKVNELLRKMVRKN